ncbi:MAG: sulfurtransferase TusA family protein [Vampirovibrionales bacterium]|nr:sulfurtransferase TusA family protein [Vampirovibrionales bacterium]
MHTPIADMTLDMRTTKCPLNFVKTRLALEKLQPGQILAVQVDATGDSAKTLAQSVSQDGHMMIATTYDPQNPTLQTFWIQKSQSQTP